MIVRAYHAVVFVKRNLQRLYHDFAVLGAQAFAGGQQPSGGNAYPLARTRLTTELHTALTGVRTPGRGNLRTPFSGVSQTRLSHPRSQSAGVSPPLSGSGLVSQVAMTAESSADATTTQVMTNLEALSLTDSVSSQRLSPIATHAALSPSKVFLACTARISAQQGQHIPAVATAAQASPPMLPPQHEVRISESASVPVTGPAVIGSTMGNDAVIAVEDTVAASSLSLAAQPD